MSIRVRLPDYCNPGTDDRVGTVVNIVTLWREQPALLKGTTYEEREDLAYVKMDKSGRTAVVRFDDCELVSY